MSNNQGQRLNPQKTNKEIKKMMIIKFTDTLYGINRKKINQIFETIRIEYWQFHQTLGHFRHLKGTVCGNRA